VNYSELIHRFVFHAAVTDEKIAKHDDIRTRCGNLAIGLNAILPEGREKSLALTKIEEAMFWANAAIARNE
jgi:hypothetical protein